MFFISRITLAHALFIPTPDQFDSHFSKILDFMTGVIDRIPAEILSCNSSRGREDFEIDRYM
jgi:hypothetical protein